MTAPGDPPSADTAGDPDLDAALLAHDQARATYIYRRLAIRRRMAVAAFLIFAVGGCVLIIAGLSSDAIAQRINALGAVIATFMMTLGGIVAAYWGVGSFDTRTMGGGGYGMGGYGGGYGMSGAYPGAGGFNSAAAPFAAPHPHLTKNPTPAGEPIKTS